MARRTWPVAALLFGSGLCALVYQTVWMREFRLVFGASTSATAAVLAIFMAGLGAGSALFGRKADSGVSPLGLYARFEFIISISAALSLPLLWIVRQAYLATGGSVELNAFAATAVRLFLAALVLAIPTLAMGGTLPAAARSVEDDRDTARRNLALLYGMNTLGAVAGTLLSTFFMLETFGNRRTLLIAALLNLLVAVVANAMSRRGTEEVPVQRAKETSADAGVSPPALPILIVAAVAGFAFLLMELVWYRMLGPLLGGTTFTFGLILAMALLGIGAGGLAYGAWNRATVRSLALITALEALAIVIPFALGDRIAVTANILRRLGDLGFGGHILGWTVITFITVFPAAFVSGIQFPMLIALLGRGKDNVGRDVGLAYAWNTAGAIAGSIAGGFGLLPLLTAPGAWRAVTVTLALLAVVIPLVAAPRGERFAARSLAVVALAFACLFATGPTAVWRHAGIGGGRLEISDSINGYREIANDKRRAVIWDADGRESSVALMGGEDLVMMLNGKSDGSATGDAGTQVMSGLIGALLHGAPQSALIVGLGTGSTAGWLAAVPTVNRVDVVELEPVALDIARACAAVNQNVLTRPNVRMQIADAREVLLATPHRYDIIFSEPSNPYRAGIASLFTAEFYEAAAKKLKENGIFLQWVQAYDIDAATLRTIYATLGGVFPNVETYWTTPGDLVLVATARPIEYDADRMRRLLATEPYKSAIQNAWRVTTLEGFLSHFVANEKTGALLASQAGNVNTDDRTTIEFSFARAVNARRAFVMKPLRELARMRGEHRPLRMRGRVDWDRVDSDPQRTNQLTDLANAAHALADAGNGDAAGYANLLRPYQPVEAEAILARLAFRKGQHEESALRLQRAFGAYRANPWPERETMRRALESAVLVAGASPKHAPPLYDSLSRPFAAGQLDEPRRLVQLAIAMESEGCGPHTLDALRSFEPHVPWRSGHLEVRARCYAQAQLGELAKRAADDLHRFADAEPEALVTNRSPSGSSSGR